MCLKKNKPLFIGVKSGSIVSAQRRCPHIKMTAAMRASCLINIDPLLLAPDAHRPADKFEMQLGVIKRTTNCAYFQKTVIVKPLLLSYRHFSPFGE